MLTYMYVTIKNNPYLGGIEINSIPRVGSIENTFSIKISRRRSDESSWQTIHTIDASSVDDMNFCVLDILVLSGFNYKYSIEVYDGDSLIEGQVYDEVSSWIEGLFVGNFNKSYVAGSNFKTDYKRNILVEYVNTLASRYPFRVQNAETNYCTGTSSGLFLELSPDNKKFLPDKYSKYSREVIDFLCDGADKILKTHDGKMWYVSIDPGAHEVHSGFWGANEIEFAWTEIDDVPIVGVQVRGASSEVLNDVNILIDGTTGTLYQLYVSDGDLGMKEITGSSSVATASIVLIDSDSGELYKVSVTNGNLMMESTTDSNSIAMAYIELFDSNNGKAYKVYVSNGKLAMELMA